MCKYSFVILHYNSVEDTFLCVSSIVEHCSSVEYRIYIVDNASPNGSGTLLAQKYEKNETVCVILSRDNLGFAKGNNLGISQALKDGYSDFIVVLNNDTKIIQNDFCDLVKKRFENSNFAVLGPTIYIPSGKSAINPGRRYLMGKKELTLWRKFYAQSVTFIERKQLLRLSVLRKAMGIWLRLKLLNRKPFRYTENCVLHGCCFVFSKVFFKKFNGFDERTFLYFEEEILYAHVMNAGLKTVYAPEIEVWHKEDGATDSVFKNNLEKTLFVYKNILKSIKVYESILEEYNLEKGNK